MKLRLVYLTTIVFLIVFTWTSLATSLWSDEAGQIYQDKGKVEFEVGDVITVIIAENSDAVQSANTSVSQGSSASAGPGLGIFSFLTNFGFNYADDDDAAGETKRSGQIKADITTLVIEKFSSGNFMISGSKTIRINGEEQLIKLAGIIRPEDVSPENTILSTRIADARIEFEGKGVVTEKQSPNIFQRVLNWIF